MFHTAGLVMLIDTVLTAVQTQQLTAPGSLFQRLSLPWNSGGLIVLLIVLGSWQGRQIYRSVVDTTTRTYQNIDDRTEEMRQATRLIDRLRGSTLPINPVLAIICQGCDGVAIKYARFFALDYRDGRQDPLYTVLNETSWAPQPVNVWQTKAKIDDVVEKLGKADIIWSIKLDPWLLTAVKRLASDSTCLDTLPHKALVRDTFKGTQTGLRCIENK